MVSFARASRGAGTHANEFKRDRYVRLPLDEMKYLKILLPSSGSEAEHGVRLRHFIRNFSRIWRGKTLDQQNNFVVLNTRISRTGSLEFKTYFVLDSSFADEDYRLYHIILIVYMQLNHFLFLFLSLHCYM